MHGQKNIKKKNYKMLKESSVSTELIALIKLCHKKKTISIDTGSVNILSLEINTPGQITTSVTESAFNFQYDAVLLVARKVCSIL